MNAEQNTFEWWLERLGKITASECGVLCMASRGDGLTKTQTAYIDKKACELVNKTLLKENELMSIYEKDQEKYNAIPDIVRGKEHEKYARMAFEVLTKQKVELCGFMVDPERSYFGASPDGLITINNQIFNIEIKCPRLENHLSNINIFNKPIKPDYIWQMVAQAHLCKTRESIFISFCAEAPEKLQLCTRLFNWTNNDFEFLLKKIDYFSGLIEHRYQALINIDDDALGLTGWTKPEELQCEQ